MSAVIESHGGVSLSLLALFYSTLLQKYCQWCQMCGGGGGDQHFRQLATVAYFSKAKCQNFIGLNLRVSLHWGVKEIAWRQETRLWCNLNALFLFFHPR